VSLLSRNNLSLDFPEVVSALEERARFSFVADGEAVAFENGQTSFARLAQRGHEPVPVFLYLFDLLYLDQYDLRRLPLLARKRLLRRAFRFGGRIRLTAYRRRDGEALFREACRRGWEGLIAKRVDSPYVGARSRDWLKFKCSNEQELVIGGYTAPHGSRIELGALLLGYYESGRLMYAGKVGTGFDRATLQDLARRLAPLRRDSSPFADQDVPARDTTWVEPRLVAQIGVSEWTRDGRLRHPRFLGLRDDKDAREVVRERSS
jgi:DNA ligase D-like protein (predicted ligase)